MNIRTIVVLVVLALLAGCDRSGPAPDAAGVEPVVLRFEVEGMTCEGCVAAVSSKIGRIEGVRDCEVSLESGSAVVRADDEGAAERILAAFEGSPYQLDRREPGSPG